MAAFPGPGGKWQLSTGGGFSVFWSKNGEELVYDDPPGHPKAVSVRARGAALEFGTPDLLFSNETAGSADVTADGERILLVIRPQAERKPPITLVANWTAGLDRR